MPAPPFKLNYAERAEVGSVIYQQRGIKLDSVERALRRIDEGVRPKNPQERAILESIYETDGLIVENPEPPPDGDTEEGEAEERAAETAEDAFSAREKAANMIAGNNEAVQAALDAPRVPSKKGSENYRSIWYLAQVTIMRVNAGESIDVYDFFEGDYIPVEARRGQEFYALVEYGYYVRIYD